MEAIHPDPNEDEDLTCTHKTVKPMKDGVNQVENPYDQQNGYRNDPTKETVGGTFGKASTA